MSQRSPSRSAAALLGLAVALAGAGCPSSGGRCESSELCPDGTFCWAGSCVAALPAGSCAAPTNPTSGGLARNVADPGITCMQGLAVPAPTIPPSWILHQGAHTVGETVGVTIPAGTTSLTIHSQGIDAAPSFTYGGQVYENSVAPTALTAPNGHLFYQYGESIPTEPERTTAYTYSGLTPWTGSFTLPSTERALDFFVARGDLPAGPWTFQVSDRNAYCGLVPGCAPSAPAGRYQVTVLARPGPYASTGTLDVSIYVVGHGSHPATFDAAAAAADPAFIRFAKGIGRLLGNAGICLGQVRFYDVPTWARTAYSNLAIDPPPPCGELSQMSMLAAPVDGVHVFLVDSFTTSMGTGIVGIDGAIPGPSGLPGAATSGAAMVMGDIGAGTCAGAFDLACGADLSAYIASHEIGHWLGLYHPTEATGDQFDPLTDTATCPCASCGQRICGASARMEPAWCTEPAAGCGGTDNLMFWKVDPSYSVGLLTAQQGMVVRSNPAVR